MTGLATSHHAITTIGAILVVEDDEALRGIVVRYLRARRYLVVEASSAEEAAEALRSGLRPDVVVLDLNLPGDTGWDLLRGAAYAAAAEPPVIVASAVTVRPSRLAEFHCAGYLPKPFPMDTLVATISRLIDHRAASAADGQEQT